MSTIIRTEIEIFSGFADDPADKKPFVVGYNNDSNWNLVFGDSIEECIDVYVTEHLSENELFHVIRKQQVFYTIYGMWVAQEKMRAVILMKQTIKNITGKSNLTLARKICEEYLG